MLPEKSKPSGSGDENGKRESAWALLCAAMKGSAHVYHMTSVNINKCCCSSLVTLKCKYSVDFRFIERLTVDHGHYFLLSEQNNLLFFFFCFIDSCRCSKKSKFCH